ncbi:LacI family DNA-binding transcriptional regulator [Pseudooceanicola sediminis]|uniref:LacI family DNA-binding transcriptional regulator n=1 Tax=Pseudooceanicola sediminis TaxID=2211117 RepID=A0A399J0F6_9RHOB|nr:substrate-binding domain-containing protein [Pseudooceanicola sediminis]KAA2314980.1 LacI family DNA-binding transcriptional regulator [Puniceibacterium sp. HSS470]RII37352.1 LacI family DNA-binding transcriptional regulator [Pseudooceanicola sediminis]|tara:strand:+ start:35200 stop:36231 length:1032 start_codon:yes stop_codon:yes gene_type:complete
MNTSDKAASGRRATISDVARQAGVSPGTVSNAMTGARRVDEHTRARIDAAIAQLNYVPNLSARSVRTGRVNSIAVLSSMPSAVSAGTSRLGFMMEIAASAAIAAIEHNMALVLVPPLPDPEATLRNIPFDGALLIEPARDDPFLDLLRRRSTPVVAIGTPPDSTMAHVDLNYGATTELLIRHLHDSGARCFPLIIGASDRASYAVTEQAYRAHATQQGMRPQVIRVPEHRGEGGARDAICQALHENPGIDGVLVPVDALATGVMQGLRDLGRSVPGDVRVVTRYDGLRARSEVPALTAVDLHLDVVAGQAISLLLRVVAGTAGADEVVHAPPPALVTRPSSGG